MPNVSAIAFFCEDVREEKSEQDTLVGVLPDNLKVPRVPSMLAKLGVYVRIHFAQSAPPKTLSLKLNLPTPANTPQEELQIGDLSDLIDKAKRDSTANGMPMAGIVARAVLAPLPLRAAGQIVAILTIDGTEQICGALNIINGQIGSTTQPSPIASAPPASQSPSVS